MMTCKRYSQLLSESMDHQLSIGQRAAVYLHGAICPPCGAYKHTLDLIRRVSRELAADVESGSLGLSPEARQRIEAVLRQAR